MTSWAKVGAKVVCVSSELFGYGDETQPETGKIYTVRGVVQSGRGFLLEEIMNPIRHYKEGFAEMAFSIVRFRPVITKTQEQDIEMFKSILTKSPEPV